MRVANWATDKVTADIEKKVMDRLEAAANQVADGARQRVPVLTGALRNSIRVVRLKGDPKLDVRVYAGNRVQGGSNKKGAERGAFYAHMVEYGTVKMKSKPFLRPSFNIIKPQVKSILENG